MQVNEFLKKLQRLMDYDCDFPESLEEEQWWEDLDPQEPINNNMVVRSKNGDFAFIIHIKPTK